jgi:putative transposase
MPRFRRLVITDYPHHITQRGVRRQTTFFDDRDYRAYLALALKLQNQLAIEFWAYCLMPNHIHAVVVPRAEGVLSQFFAMLHRSYARRINARNDWRGHLWQERFYSVVMDEAHTLSAMRYVELNPVRAGLVESAKDWPWSSARGNLNLSQDPLIRPDATRGFVSNWRDYLAGPADDGELESLRRRIRIGRPDGDIAFMDSVEALSGRCVRKRKRGKQKKVTGTFRAKKR